MIDQTRLTHARSNPAITRECSNIRDCFPICPPRASGYATSRFVHVKGGVRECQGVVLKIECISSAPMSVRACGGKAILRDAEIAYMHEHLRVLTMTVDEAVNFFRPSRRFTSMLTWRKFGLVPRPGPKRDHASGAKPSGSARRRTEPQQTGHTLYILEPPTTDAFADVDKCRKDFHTARPVNTLIAIEHNPMSSSRRLGIDLGPDGEMVGRIVAHGHRRGSCIAESHRDNSSASSQKLTPVRQSRTGFG